MCSCVCEFVHDELAFTLNRLSVRVSVCSSEVMVPVSVCSMEHKRMVN